MNRCSPPLRRVAAVCLLSILITHPAPAVEADPLADALTAVAQRDYVLARDLARSVRDPVAVDIVDWHRLRAGEGSWAEYRDFLARNADWPGLPLMKKAAEGAMPSGLPAAEVRAFFAGTGPQTGRGTTLLAAALEGDARGVALRRTWAEIVMGAEDRQAFVSRHVADLRPATPKRLENLLWAGQATAAADLLSVVPAGEAAVARARIGLQQGAKGVDALIEAVPVSHAGDPGLAWDRFRWRLRKGRWDDAAELLAERSTSAAALGRPEAWANQRRSVARDMMRDGKPRLAYRLASQHFLTEGSDYADLEWLSGYIALTYMKDPVRALRHFEAFRRSVSTPISYGRAGYWLGRAYEAQGDGQKAREAFGFGAAWQTSFYGQLAAERVLVPADPSLARWGGLPDWNARPFARSGVVKAARLLMAAGNEGLATRFLLHAQESLGPEDSAALARLAVDMDLMRVAVIVGKRLASDGVIYPEAYYPVTDLAKQVRGIPPELAMAIARQESELNPRAQSGAGARGLMQLMPGTARKMSARLELKYDAGRLLSDPAYNARLGAAYLEDMLERYDGALILAAAAYNAGPARVDEWLGRFGDPRRPGVDPVDWIEHIPFRETRNYVMRVMESLHVYRSRINRGAGEIGLTRRLGPA